MHIVISYQPIGYIVLQQDEILTTHVIFNDRYQNE